MRRIHRHFGQVEIENCWLAQGIDLVRLVVWHKDVLFHGNVSLLADQQGERPAGSSIPVCHILVHQHREDLGWRVSQILVGAIKSYDRVLGRGLDLESTEHVLRVQHAAHHYQQGYSHCLQFHGYLHDKISFIVVTLQCQQSCILLFAIANRGHRYPIYV